MGELSLRRRLALELWRIEERRAAQEHKLQQLFWECALRCNLHCRHCGSDPDLQLTNEEFRRLMEYIQKTRKEGRIRVDYGCEGFLGRYEGEVRNRFFGCRAGISVGSVLADGIHFGLRKHPCRLQFLPLLPGQWHAPAGWGG